MAHFRGWLISRVVDLRLETFLALVASPTRVGRLRTVCKHWTRQ